MAKFQFVYNRDASRDQLAEKSGGPQLSATRSGSLRTSFLQLAIATAGDITRYALIMGESPDPVGPHQFRVGLRRFRTLLKLYRPVLDDGFRKTHNAAAKDLAALASTVRRLDVAIDDMAPLARGKVPDEDLAALTARFQKAAESDGSRAEAAAATPRFLLALHQDLLQSTWTAKKRRASKALAKPVAQFTGQALEKQWRLMRALGDRLDTLTIEERHELRKVGKTMRYAVAFFGPLYPPAKVERIATPLRRLQNVLGSMNDAAEAELLIDFAPEERYRAALEAIISVQKQRLTDDWPKVEERWADLAAAKPFWKR